jgi:hypothetical protein
VSAVAVGAASVCPVRFSTAQVTSVLLCSAQVGSAFRWSARHWREPPYGSAIDLDIIEKYLARTHPQSERSVECAVNDQRLFCLRVGCRPDHLVQATFVMPIGAGGDVW